MSHAGSLSSSGSEFQTVEPATGKARRPYVLSRQRGTMSWCRLAERSRCRDATLITKKGKPIEGLPPTEAALLQNAKRAALQIGYYWHQCMSAQQTWGWVVESSDHWKPLWTTLPDAAKFCPELLRCNCKKGCNKSCKCAKAKTKCRALC